MVRAYDSSFSSYEDPPLWLAIMVYIQFAVLILVGRLRDLLHKIGLVENFVEGDRLARQGFKPVLEVSESFFIRNIYRRGLCTLNRPIASAPSVHFDVMERKSDDHWWTCYVSGRLLPAINFGSYNYLGFAEPKGYCSNQVEEEIRRLGVGVCSPRQEIGTLGIHHELESYVAQFVGKEAAITFSMGFATNALNLPALIGPGCCIISDEINHASLILGVRLSGAEVKRFKHNNMTSLEQKLQEAMIYGCARTHRPFKKILIVVEGIYSMEGTILNLPEIIRLKKKYKAYLFVDEAHSIGALGPRGRGVVDYFDCDPNDVDILMGTFSKSFGAAGGYIASSKVVVDLLRHASHANAYGAPVSPPVARQVIASMQIIMGQRNGNEGRRRLRQLAWNCRYFRRRLAEMKFIVYGHRDSPVVPIILFLPANFPFLGKEGLKRGIGVVVVGFPATPLLLNRARFCLSAGHTKAMLDKALGVLEQLGNFMLIRVSRKPLPPWCLEDIGASPEEEDKPESAKMTISIKPNGCPNGIKKRSVEMH